MIFIHDTVIDPISQRGVDRVFTNYLTALSNFFPDQVLLYSNKVRNTYHLRRVYPPSKYMGCFIPSRVNNVFDNTCAKLLVDYKPAVYFSPYFGTVRSTAPQVFSAYDMIYERFPQYFTGESEKRFIREKKACFERSSLIICISHSTANDLMEIYPNLSADKIRVVHLGIDEEFLTKFPVQNTDKPYLLYVGSRHHYKNFLRLLEAIGKMQLPRDLYLRVISPVNNFPTNQESEIINRYHLAEKIVFESDIPDSLLQTRYQNAFAYIFESTVLILYRVINV